MPDHLDAPVILALDTCLAACSVALLRGAEILAWRTEAMTRGHQERLAPMVHDLMAEQGMGFPMIDRIGVTLGPGSFTGLRVGLAFAKGLALALGKPCVGVGTLEALAAGVVGEGAVAAVIDAGRGRLYLQLFDGGAALSGPDILSLELAISRLVEVFPLGDVTLTGPGVDLLAAALPGAQFAPQSAPDPRALARLAARAAIVAPRPLYLRPPDAKIKAAAA